MIYAIRGCKYSVDFLSWSQDWGFYICCLHSFVHDYAGFDEITVKCLKVLTFYCYLIFIGWQLLYLPT
jgi:hypothetical protein